MDHTGHGPSCACRPEDSDRVSGMPRKTPPRAQPHAGALSRSPAPRPPAEAAGRVPSRTPPKATRRTQSPGAPKRSHQENDCGRGRRGSGRSAGAERTGTRVSADRFARSTSPTDQAMLRRMREALQRRNTANRRCSKPGAWARNDLAQASRMGSEAGSTSIFLLILVIHSSLASSRRH